MEWMFKISCSVPLKEQKREYCISGLQVDVRHHELNSREKMFYNMICTAPWQNWEKFKNAEMLLFGDSKHCRNTGLPGVCINNFLFHLQGTRRR